MSWLDWRVSGSWGDVEEYIVAGVMLGSLKYLGRVYFVNFIEATSNRSWKVFR